MCVSVSDVEPPIGSAASVSAPALDTNSVEREVRLSRRADAVTTGGNPLESIYESDETAAKTEQCEPI